MQPPAGEEEIYRLPDDIFLLILSHFSTDIKSLARCSVVSSRFRFLVSLVPSLLIHVNQIFSFHSEILPSIIHLLVSEISLQPMTYHSRYSPHPPRSIIHRVPIDYLLKKFSNLRSLHIDLSSGEINLDRCTSTNSSPTLFHWHAHFGSSLNRCLIIGASSFSWIGNEETDVADYDHWAYKDIAVLWANVALIAASSRHHRLQRTVKEHANIESLVVTDADGQGVFRMDRDQLKELRKGPVLASSANERTILRQRWG
ncbi:hypothetical protein MLD38_016505 [Melastoma candidum]|nr:hypothetical protein MLD38_016505 [Melastoma candidum]